MTLRRRVRAAATNEAVARAVYRLARRVDNLSLRMLDATVASTAWVLALLAGYEGAVPRGVAGRLTWMIIIVVLVQVAAHHWAGLYGPVWRYASVEEGARVAVGVFGGVCAGAVTLAILGRVTGTGLPLYTAPLVAGLLILIGCGGIRFQSRLFALERHRSRGSGLSTIIVGAGIEGASLATELSTTEAGRDIEVAGFVDDDPLLAGRSIRGLPVLGTTAELERICAVHRVDRVLVALPEVDRSRVKGIVDQALCTDAQVKVLPPASERVTGPLLRSVRDIDVTDLLGRKHAPVDSDGIRDYLAGATVLVTGAGGSIGSEVARQVAAYGPAELVLLDRDETLLHDVLTGPLADAHPVLADICDQAALDAVFATHRPDVVFHAAAQKHVPMLEAYPVEAVRTNVLGTWSLATTAAAHGCGRFVHISTDKAADPCSVMGATKRVAEHVVFEVGRRYRLPYVAVRFGNVLGSRGSVVPTFLRQILEGGPVTVTSPEMTRYFMTIPEAVSLVLQSAAMADDGRIFLLEMGKPVSIIGLARQMIRLAGMRPDEDIEIELVGLRPGERLHERLHDDAEVIGDASHPSISALTPRLPWGWEGLQSVIATFSDHVAMGAGPAAKRILEDTLRQAGISCTLQHDGLDDDEIGARASRLRALPVQDGAVADDPNDLDLREVVDVGRASAASPHPLAVLGGEPAFDVPLPFARPALPPLEDVVDRYRPSYERGIVTNGPLVRELEERIADRLGVPHVVAVSSCTTGLVLAVQALVEDRPGPVVLPSFTFSASGHAARWNGRQPCFAEVDPHTFQVDVDALESIIDGASAVLATHVFGAPCQPDRVEAVARAASVPVVFDAAHALGARHGERPIGGFGDVEVFSLTPTKVLVAGEGGIVATRDAELARRLRHGRDYGNPGNYDTQFVGLNGRMSEVHAATALGSLEILDASLRRRRQLASRYRRGLDEVPGLRYQQIALGDESTFKDFTVRVDESELGLTRDAVTQVLAAEGIDTRNYFDPPVHRQRSYRDVPAAHLPSTDALSSNVVSLPIYPDLSDEDVDRVVEVLRAAHEQADHVTEELRATNRTGPLRPWRTWADAR